MKGLNIRQWLIGAISLAVWTGITFPADAVTGSGDTLDLGTLLERSTFDSRDGINSWGNEANEDLRFLFEEEKPGMQDFTQSLQLINEGKYADAVKIVREGLRKEPDSAAGHEVLGAALALQGDLPAGLAELKRAVEISPAQSTAITKIGDIYLAQDEPAKAREQFEKAIAVAPQNRHAHQRLGILFEQEGKLEEAISHFELGIKGTPPEYVGVKVNLGAAYNRKQRYQQTIMLLTGIISPEKGGAAGQIVLGTAHLTAGQPEKALPLFQAAASQEPAKGLIPLGIILRSLGKKDESLDALTNAVHKTPDSPIAHYQRGETLFSLKRYDEALQAYEQAAAKGYPSRQAAMKKADLLVATGAVDKAAALYEELIGKPDATAPDFDRLASLFEATGELGRAEQTLKKMTNTFPKDGFSWYRLGVHYGLVQKYSDAIVNLKRALSLDRDNPQYTKALALAYQRQGDKQAAIASARELSRLQPGNTENILLLAALLEEEGLSDEAITEYRRILGMNPTHGVALNNLAGLLGVKGRIPEAVEMAKKAVAAYPDNGRMQDTLGWLLQTQGNPQGALQALEKANELTPETPTILYHLGVAQEKLGKKDDAKASLKKAIEISENFKEAGEAKKLLEKL